MEGALPRGSAPYLLVDSGAERYVRDLAVAPGPIESQAIDWQSPNWQSPARAGGRWLAPVCRDRGCRVRYRFLLAEAAAALDDVGVAAERHAALLAPPSTWLLRPSGAPPGVTYRFAVTAPPGVQFASGVSRARARRPSGALVARDALVASNASNASNAPDVLDAPDALDAFEAPAADLSLAPYSVLGPLRRRDLDVEGARVEVAALDADFAVGDAAIDRWIASAARVVAGYYGRFPVPRVLVIVVPTEGDRIGFASMLGSGGASIVANVGQHVDEAELADDWVMTHEMVHLAAPGLARRHAWLEEGIATYVEPIARARAGVLTPERVWRGLVRGLPHGLPEPGDRGLDRTPTWGRTYWGGALFCLLADIAIRERTGGRRSLDDALRGILAAGGNASVRWSIEALLDAGDRATGVPVLRELYARMATEPVPVDLDALFRRLGVERRGGQVVLSDDAPLAAIRRGIVSGR